MGGSQNEVGRNIFQTADGGYVAGAMTNSEDGDLDGVPHQGAHDYWIFKLDAAGDNIEWQKCTGGSGEDFLLCVTQAFDGGYIACGRSFSNDGEVTNHHGDLTGFNFDCWVARLDGADPSGPLLWDASLGGTGYDGANWILQTPDTGYIIAAETYSDDEDVTGFHAPDNKEDSWVVKLKSDAVSGIFQSHLYSEKKEATLFPNPMRVSASLQLYGAIAGKTEFLLYDLTGRQVMVKEITGQQLDILRGDLAAGIYFFEVISENEGKVFAGGKFVME